MYSLAQEAYCKPILHALKYPSQSVLGILVGEEKGNKINITDAFPLFHGSVLAPMTELALTQIDEVAKERKSKIVGVYFANEGYENQNLHPIAANVGEKIQSQFPSAFVLMIDNTKATSKENSFLLYNYSNKQWQLSNSLELSEGNIPSLLSGYVEEKRHWNLVDFDEHLEDTQKDWLNKDLFS